MLRPVPAYSVFSASSNCSSFRRGSRLGVGGPAVFAFFLSEVLRWPRRCAAAADLFAAAGLVAVEASGGAADVEPALIKIMRANISRASANRADTPITTLRLLLPSFTYA